MEKIIVDVAQSVGVLGEVQKLLLDLLLDHPQFVPMATLGMS